MSPSLEALSRRGCTSSPHLENVLVACFVSLPPSFMSWKEVTRWLCGGPLDHLAAALTSVSCVNGEKVLLMETAQKSRVSALMTSMLLFTPFFLLVNKHFMSTYCLPGSILGMSESLAGGRRQASL